MGRKIVFVAVALYICVIGCAMWPGDHPTGMYHKIKSTGLLVPISDLKPYCGVAIRLQRVDWVEEYKQTIDRVADDGCDSVSLVVDARQENASSTQMYIDMRKTMTVAQLTDIINHAKSRKLRVVLMPVVLLDKPATDKEWRGTLLPKRIVDPSDPERVVCDETSWHEWFDSYRDTIEHYARIAQATNVDVLVVGSELVSSEEQPWSLDEWTDTINRVRDIYKGHLTYSSNWDRYWHVPFWSQLDLVGMNSYWDLSDGQYNPTKEEIEGVSHPDSKGRNWQAIQSKMFAFLAEVHKPVILLEAGWCSLSNAAGEPWDYTQEDLPADNELQKKLYDAFFESWWGKTQCAGFMMWEMEPGNDPTGKGYTPEGKPAEQTMREWMKKPRWTVGAE